MKYYFLFIYTCNISFYSKCIIIVNIYSIQKKKNTQQFSKLIKYYPYYYKIVLQ